MRNQNYFPRAYAVIHGGSTHPNISGIANFYSPPDSPGVLIEVELTNLPTRTESCPYFLGLHLHETGDCNNNFNNTGMHYNPENTEHPCHAGDFPSILNNNGYAYLAFYDAFLSLDDVTNRSIVVHDRRDDFTSQPAGDSGTKIACGVIRTYK